MSEEGLSRASFPASTVLLLGALPCDALLDVRDLLKRRSDRIRPRIRDNPVTINRLDRTLRTAIRTQTHFCTLNAEL